MQCSFYDFRNVCIILYIYVNYPVRTTVKLPQDVLLQTCICLLWSYIVHLYKMTCRAKNQTTFFVLFYLLYFRVLNEDNRFKIFVLPCEAYDMFFNSQLYIIWYSLPVSGMTRLRDYVLWQFSLGWFIKHYFYNPYK